MTLVTAKNQHRCWKARARAREEETYYESLWPKKCTKRSLFALFTNVTTDFITQPAHFWILLTHIFIERHRKTILSTHFACSLMPGSTGKSTLKSLYMKRFLLYLLFIFACLSSCTTSCKIGHQVTVHDMLHLNHHATLCQWGIRHDGVHLRDCILCHDNQRVKARWREHWPLQHDNKRNSLQLNDLRGRIRLYAQCKVQVQRTEFFNCRKKSLSKASPVEEVPLFRNLYIQFFT